MSAMSTNEAAYDARRAARRNDRALQRLNDALSNELAVPPPVTEVAKSARGTRPLLPAEAFELARQVYYLGGGSKRDCARAILAAGLAPDVTADPRKQEAVTRVTERLQTWWRREGWPVRPTSQVFVIRDAQNDGGLYRSARSCRGVATGSGPAPKGKTCTNSPLSDSDYCAQHDPRPRFVEMRRLHGQHLRASRRRDLVPVAPLSTWMDCERRMLVLEARERGDWLDPKQTGWGLLAEKLRMNGALVHRIGTGRGTNSSRGAEGAASAHGQIKAATAVKYLERAGVTFRDVYGFDPPIAEDRSLYVCPECGGHKDHQAKMCRDCHEKLGQPCAYVNRRGEQCNVRTMHPSGFCGVCRRILARRANPRPRRGRASFVTVPMLMLAADAYVDTPNLRWVAWQRMWPVNAAGCRDVFKTAKSLEGSLVKAFRRRGWSTPPGRDGQLRSYESIPVIQGRVLEALDELIAEHGPVVWPTEDAQPPAGQAALIALEPFRAWITERYREVGSFRALQERIAISDDTLSKWVNRKGRKGGQLLVRRATVERALELWGDGTRIVDVYGTVR